MRRARTREWRATAARLPGYCSIPGRCHRAPDGDTLNRARAIVVRGTEKKYEDNRPAGPHRLCGTDVEGVRKRCRPGM